MSADTGADRLAEGALDRLRRLVELESPSSDEPRLRAVASELVSQLVALGADVDTVDADGVGEHVVAELAGAEPGLEPVLVLGHFDTVHPVGAFDPVFAVRGGRAYGPGTFDMKGGWACMLEALATFRADGAHPRRPVRILATCDEETGSATSRQLIEEMARACCSVLVLEPPLPGGAAKTRRKGAARYRVRVEGRAAHAGLAPEDGINAIVELARQLLAITALAAPDVGTTVTATMAGGGTATNVVPPSAWADVDVRFTTAAEAERVDRAIRSLAPHAPGAGLAVEGGVDRPPMERTPGVASLYERARALAAESGWELGEGSAGGASDGSLTAGLGVPTLDGIGAEGGGAHASDEHVLVADLPRRVRLYRRLLESL